MLTQFSRKGTFYVYILRCSDGTLYTGYTPKLKHRIKLHNNGKGAKYTRGRGPVKLVWHKKYKTFRPAVLAERRIQGLTRKQKEDLIAKRTKSRSRLNRQKSCKQRRVT